MTRRHRGEFLAECNSCGTTFAGGVEDDFRDFIDELKDDGWKIVRSEDEDGEGTGEYSSEWKGR